MLLIAYGVLVIGLVDNVLRPMLVGKDTKLPDYVVLISTLGGMAIFGLNGFVIGPLIAAMFIAALGRAFAGSYGGLGYMPDKPRKRRHPPILRWRIAFGFIRPTRQRPY